MATFDQYSDSYRSKVQQAIGCRFQDVDACAWIKAHYLVAQANLHLGPARTLSVLDVGCGVGLTDRYLTPAFGRVTGVDVSADSVRRAAEENAEAEYFHADGDGLPFEDKRFDLAFAICVLHHVPPPAWERFVAEMRRVVRDDGLVLIFEHNPWNPFTRWAVSRCPFDADAVLLSRRRTRRLLAEAGLQVLDQRFFLFTPWVNRFGRAVDRVFRKLPLGCQYLIAARRSAA